MGLDLEEQQEEDPEQPVGIPEQQVAEANQLEEVKELPDDLIDDHQANDLVAHDVMDGLHEEEGNNPGVGQEQFDGEIGQQADALVAQNVIQLGLVRTYFVNPPDTPKTPLISCLAPKAMGPNEGQGKIIIEVPKEWMGFFQALL